MRLESPRRSCIARNRRRCTAMENEVSPRRHGDEDCAQDEPSSPYTKLKKAYEQMCDKYQIEKEKKLEEAERLFEDHQLKTVTYSKATNQLLELAHQENAWLRQLVEESGIEEAQARIKELEKKNALYRNELLVARAKDHQSELVKEDKRGFLQRLLQSLSQMEIIEEDTNSTRFLFVHQSTGLKFTLEPVMDSDVAKICGGDREVKFVVITLGSLIHVAPQWMREKSITFSISHAPIFFRRLQSVVSGRPVV